MPVLFLVIGLSFSIIGAELLIKGASKLASAFGISPLIIGLTVVAIGTSMPEITVSVISALEGKSDVAVGNVVGSNIFNILFILGLASLILPLFVSYQLIRLDIPIMILVSFWVLIISYDGVISRVDGSILFLMFIIYTTFLIFICSKKKMETSQDISHTDIQETNFLTSNYILYGIYIITGLGLLVFGSHLLVKGAISIALYFGVSELVIGLTLIAAGTSLPEVVTSVLASIRGERDIAVGNVVGSNIFNILAVLGMSSIVSPNGLTVSPALVQFDIPVMIAVAVACFPIFFTGYVISRWEGGVFFTYYIAYTLYIVLAATNHESLSVLNMTMVWFVIPLTITVFFFFFVQAVMLRKKS